MSLDDLKPEEYLVFQDKGIDIDACHLDYKLLSVHCKDLSLYRKAFRVKIRALIKSGDVKKLKTYVNAFYTLAKFVKYLYGNHSCACEVEPWQEDLANHLKTRFENDDTGVYEQGSWIEYEDVQVYEKYFREEYAQLGIDSHLDTSKCIQDSKPFLNQKDKAHFNKCFKH